MDGEKTNSQRLKMVLSIIVMLSVTSLAQETGVPGMERGNKLQPKGVSSGPSVKVQQEDHKLIRKAVSQELSKYFVKKEDYWEYASLAEDLFRRDDRIEPIKTEQGEFLNGDVLNGEKKHVRNLQISHPILGYHPTDARSPKDWPTKGVLRTYTCLITYIGHRSFNIEQQRWTEWQLENNLGHLPNALIVDFMENGECVVRYPNCMALKAFDPKGNAEVATALEAAFVLPE